MQFPSKNQKYKCRPNSEIHESETVAGFLSQQLWPNRLFRVFVQVSQLLKPRISFLHCYFHYLNLFDISKKNYFSVTYTGTIPMELFNVKKVGFCSVQLKRFKRNCQHFRIVYETILIR